MIDNIDMSPTAGGDQIIIEQLKPVKICGICGMEMTQTGQDSYRCSRCGNWI